MKYTYFLVSILIPFPFFFSISIQSTYLSIYLTLVKGSIHSFIRCSLLSLMIFNLCSLLLFFFVESNVWPKINIRRIFLKIISLKIGISFSLLLTNTISYLYGSMFLLENHFEMIKVCVCLAPKYNKSFWKKMLRNFFGQNFFIKKTKKT